MNQQNGSTNTLNAEVNKIPSHNRKGLVITLLIFFWPIGLYWLLKSDVFKRKTKIIVTIIFSFFIISFLITSISENKIEHTPFLANSSTTENTHAENSQIKYTIISDEHKSNIKRTVEVELTERTNEKTLKEIAEKIFSMATEKYERTFIGYRLTGDSNNGYWATTHFNPDLEIKILGSDQYTHEQVKSAPLPDGEIIGTWLANWGFERKMTAYQKDGVVYMKSFETEDGEEIEASVLDGKVKLQYDGGKKGEYYLINSDGNLEFWSERGNYYTAPKL